MSGSTENEGEGSRTAAKQYNEETRRFTETEDVAAKAEEARAAAESGEAEELRSAEEKGKEKARGEDPQVHRDR